MSNSIPWFLGDDTISVMLEGEMHIVSKDSHVIDELVTVLKSDTPDLTRLRALLNPAAAIADALSAVDVKVVGKQVTYRGKVIPTNLAKRLIEIIDWGLPSEPWKLFIARVMANPSQSAREELALFLEANQGMPITDDGCFLAYKRVDANLKDCRTHTFDNSVGRVVTMDRSGVDPDRYKTCSAGLHFCAASYLPSYTGARTVLVKVDPADVVAIPSDYRNAKGRTWRYEVVAELVNGSASAPVFNYDKAIISDIGTPVDVPQDFNDEAPEVSENVEKAFVEPGAPRTSIWSKAFGAVTGR
jgi:hypothetical protein